MLVIIMYDMQYIPVVMNSHWIGQMLISLVQQNASDNSDSSKYSEYSIKK